MASKAPWASRSIYLGALDCTSASKATGDHDLTGGETVPSGALLKNIVGYVHTTVTSGGTPTVQLKTANDTELTAAVNPETAANIESTELLKPDNKKMAAADAGTCKVTIATASLTGGRLDFYADLLMPAS